MNIKHEYSLNGESYFVTLQEAGNDYCNVFTIYSIITFSYNKAGKIHSPKKGKRSHLFMISTKNHQFLALPPPPTIPKNEQ